MGSNKLKAGLLGYPIDHSLSPAIHTAAYAALGLDWEYGLYPCEDSAAFARIINEARLAPQSFVGFNVTTPYKVEAFAASDAQSPYAQNAQNANVLTFSKPAENDLACDAAGDGAGRLCLTQGRGKDVGGAALVADNTDGRGLVAAIERETGRSLAGCSIVLCGTGAVARSTAYALVERKVGQLTIASRNPSGQTVSYDSLAEPLAQATVLIDATTLGMRPGDGAVVPASWLRPELVVVDVVYGHGETELIRRARSVGAQAVDGLGMLIEQAALTIELWAQAQGFTVEVPRDIMRAATQGTDVVRGT